jgi:hypothetical protein
MRCIPVLAVVLSLTALFGSQAPLVAGAYEDGVAASKHGDYQVAIGLLERVVQAEPKRAAAHCWLGVTYAQYISSSPRASGTLKEDAVRELEQAVKLDRQGPWGKLAREWLQMLNPPRPELVLQSFTYLGAFPRERAQEVKRRAVAALKLKPELVLVAGRGRSGKAWTMAVEMGRWEITRPTAEEIAKAEKHSGSLLKGLGNIPMTNAKAGARVTLRSPAPASQETSLLVETSHLEIGYDNSAEEKASDEAAKELGKSIAARVALFFELRTEKPITDGLFYTRRPIGSMYALAGVTSKERAGELPVVAVTPFAWPSGGKREKEASLLGANMVARSLVASGKYWVIIPRDFRASTKVDAKSFALPERARVAGGKVGADYAIVGEVVEIESFSHQAFLQDKSVKSKATLNCAVVRCSDKFPALDEKERECVGEAKAPSGADPDDAPDLREKTIREALKDAGDKAVKAVMEALKPRETRAPGGREPRRIEPSGGPQHSF